MKQCLMALCAVVMILTACNKQATFDQPPNGLSDNTPANATIGKLLGTGEDWIYKTTFPSRRDGASSFVINNKLYVFGGKDESHAEKKDLWEYDPAANTWTQKASLPHAARARMWAVGFAIGNKGYIATGFDDSHFPFELKDCWQYDPATNSWTQKADLQGAGRYGAAAFVINGRAYVGMGSTIDPSSPFFLNDFWEYDPAANNWQQKASIQTTFDTQGRSFAFSFTLNNKGYVGTGNGPVPQSAYNDMWQYNATTDTWTKKADFPGGKRSYATAVATLSFAYAGTGEFRELGSPDAYYAKDFWRYDPANDSWLKRADFEGYKRRSAIAFYSNGYPYLGLGYNPNYSSTSDIYRYIP